MVTVGTSDLRNVQDGRQHDAPCWTRQGKEAQVLRVVDPFETAVHVREDGTVDIGEQTDSRVRTGEDGVIVADLPPGVRANLGAVRMSGSSKHHGERHPEGDELVYLLSGYV